MFRKPVRTIVCPSCGRLTRADASECLICGRRRPGLWGATQWGRRLFRGGVVQVIMVVCVALYVAGLVGDPAGALRPRGLFDILAPSNHVLYALGGSGAAPWWHGRWWTILTASYLHGNLLHILFNLLWIRQLGPAVEEAYGTARLVIVFVVAGAAGFGLSTAAGVPFTVGASAAIFGLLAAMIVYGRRRGGLFGRMVLREYGQWAAILFIFGLLPGNGIDNWAHAGGFLGGGAASLVLSLAERRGETPLDHGLAAALGLLTVMAFGLCLWTAIV